MKIVIACLFLIIMALLFRTDVLFIAALAGLILASICSFLGWLFSPRKVRTHN